MDGTHDLPVVSVENDDPIDRRIHKSCFGKPWTQLPFFLGGRVNFIAGFRAWCFGIRIGSPCERDWILRGESQSINLPSVDGPSTSSVLGRP